ncbi:phospholipase D-like domain-containing protein [Stigmatella aurantiaca]|uniref:Phospholipase D family protein n=1 Tax=Stigmatella aurantiaca (strain DW4/3-1) TaxID=378806 RepID=Q08UL7_STIAD|nr:phospholipase D-like domain-containing protein [Stigmatella aurantiaca]ADO68961.1 Phospholipase D family protein [Stigmatella aurantiaca DW4/3-1]EAU64182.1 phospholipase D/Transphosphatidylase [Stigmatella aurantiaca DW4/3-1]
MKRILEPGRNCWTQAEAHDAGVLVDGRDYYQAFYREALRAKSYIAIAGWQFDSDVSLLRGEDARQASGELRMLPLLRALCEKNPDLHVYILAWDFNVLLAMEREWMQHTLFNGHSERLSFRFDASAPLYAAHHQKLVLIDGRVAFTGGMDICDCRWDDRSHPARSTLRCDNGRDPHGPYHDVQAVLTGPVVETLAELFEARWFNSGGGTLRLPPPVSRDDVDLKPTVPLLPGPVAICRTFGKTLVPFQEQVQEIRELYLDAIDAAEHFLYFENQYFSSRILFDALVRRMRAKDRSRLNIVFILPRMPEALREQLAMGVAQVRLLRLLKRVAAETGHSVGVYCSVSRDDEGKDVYTYVHSKLLVVDDCFLTLGSANTTNRSLGVDSELNLAWEAPEEDGQPLCRAIRRLRVSLMSELSGLGRVADLRRLARTDGLVAFLDAVAARGQARLRPHPLETVVDQNPFFKPLVPEELVFDPEDTLVDESLFESLKQEQSLVASGVRFLARWFGSLPERPHPASLPAVNLLPHEPQ